MLVCRAFLKESSWTFGKLHSANCCKMNLSDSIAFYRIFPVVSLRSATGYRWMNPCGFVVVVSLQSRAAKADDLADSFFCGVRISLRVVCLGVEN